MKRLKSLILLQIKDKIDLSFLSSKKEILRTIIFSILKFIIVSIVVFFILFLCKKFIFVESDIPKIIVLVITFILFLQLITCSLELMNNLYFSEDNRVLITFPVNTNRIFISKLIVFFIYEIKKSLTFIVPFMLGCTLFLTTVYSVGNIEWYLNLWMLIPLFIINIIVILLGSLISIPLMYITRIIKKSQIVEALLLFVLLIIAIVGIVYLINLIPENIDLINQWPSISNKITTMLPKIEKKLFVNRFIYTMIGEYNPSLLTYQINLVTFEKTGILLLSAAVLFLMNYFISRPLFFKMMAKNFEINKNKIQDKPNRTYNKYFTFVNKEFIVNMRTINIALNYLIIYIIIPILILLLNALFKAMDTREFGNQLIWTFNILLITLPLLASNAMVATYYSREGRAAYLKKTKPILAIYPLFAKLFFNILFSIPTVFITVWIFGSSVNFSGIEIFFLGLAILFLHLGHMIYSAMLDIMNPQNEQYATTGGQIDNPNENKSTIIAFVLSFLYALIAYKLLSEASLEKTMIGGVSKLTLVSMAIFGSTLMIFIKRVKAFYASIQG